jgi:hypothetical protein
MARIWIIILLTGLVLKVSAQQFECNCEPEDDYNTVRRNTLMGFEYIDPLAGFEQEHFFNNWVVGEVSFTNGEVIRDIFLRYDMYQDELLWMRMSDLKRGVLTKSRIAGFKLPDNMGTFIKSTVKLPMLQDTVEVYLQVLLSDKFQLYAYRHVTIEGKADEITDNTLYLLVHENNNYWIPLSRRSLLNLPGIDKAKMKSVIRERKQELKDNETVFINAIRAYLLAR